MDEAYLTQLYEGLGHKVVSVRLIKDRMTGRPQGYCFLEFESKCSIVFFMLESQKLEFTFKCSIYKVTILLFQSVRKLQSLICYYVCIRSVWIVTLVTLLHRDTVTL